ncbi:MAG TPA: hypothetical protein VEC37_10080, partial [Bacillota bacterium]|nr:hypothetical protein [Bacillota bacterium]
MKGNYKSNIAQSVAGIIITVLESIGMGTSLAWVEAGFLLSMILSGLAIAYVAIKGKRNKLSFSFLFMHLLLLIWSTGDF